MQRLQSRGDDPDLDGQDIELGALFAQGLVAERGTRRRYSVFKDVVEPEAISPVSVRFGRRALGQRACVGKDEEGKEREGWKLRGN